MRQNTLARVGEEPFYRAQKKRARRSLPTTGDAIKIRLCRGDRHRSRLLAAENKTEPCSIHHRLTDF
ncbi:unnamed protein product [Camellia sinensis]